MDMRFANAPVLFYSDGIHIKNIIIVASSSLHGTDIKYKH